MEVSGRQKDEPIYASEKEPAVPGKYEAVCVPDPVWTLWKKKDNKKHLN
jgi:hypothetical protein